MQPCRFKPLRIDDSLDEKQAKFRRDKICQGDYPESRFKFCGTESQLQALHTFVRQKYKKGSKASKNRSRPHMKNLNL